MPHLRTGLLALLLLTPPAFADTPPTDDKLKEAALKLNEAGTQEAALEAADKLLKPKADAVRLVKLAAQMQKDADKPPLKFNAAYALARVATIVKEYDAAEGLFESCDKAAKEVSSPSKLLAVLDGLMRLYWDQKKWADAETTVKTALEVKEKTLGDELGGWLELAELFERLIQLRGLQGAADDGVSKADGLIKSFPVVPLRPLFLTPKAAVLAEAGRPAEAVKTVEKFLKDADELGKVFKPEAVASYKTMAKHRLSGYQTDADDIDGAVKTLRELLADKPESATAHNDLGFLLADHDKGLEEAETLCRKALELDAAARKKLLAEGKIEADLAKQESSAYLDSLGWVLFKQGKYKDALPYLEKAAADEDDGRHIEIWDHLADCLMKLQQRDKAIATWEKCLTFDDVSRRDVERRKKVSGKLKAAKQK
jgi:tetratricopeptide (TPR) repeat protein